MSSGDTPPSSEDGVTRRVVVACLATGTVAASSPAVKAEAIMAPASLDDERFMRQAIMLAKQGDFPFGALIVRDGQIFAMASNIGKKTQDPTAHAEMVAIRHFLREHELEGLKGATLYTSGEPCAMCMGAILWCGIGRVVYAASIAQMSTHLGQIMIPCAEIAAKTPFAKIEITGGVLAEEALKLFRSPDGSK